MCTDSPRYLRSNTLNHLVESHVRTSRAAIKADLLDKIVSFYPANAEDISLLMELVERASKKTPEELEIEEINDTANDLKKEERSGNHGSAEEKKKYDPLVSMFLATVSSFVLTLIYYRCAYSTS
jgi:hypothetical protein